MKSEKYREKHHPKRIMKTPRKVEILITNECNLKCIYCSHYSSSREVEHDVVKEEWLNFFEELKKCKVMEIILEGGEPFCRSDILEIIDGIVRNNMRFSIISNGTLITEKIAEHIAATGRCNSMRISIDGMNASVNDSFRGKGSFQRAMRGINILKNYPIPVSVSITIHKNNVNCLDAIAGFFLDHLNLSCIYTNTAFFLGSCRNKSETVILSVEEQSLAIETLYKLKTKYPNRNMDQDGSLADAKKWSLIEKSRQKNDDPKHDEGYLSVCKKFSHTIAVRSDGVLTPCLHLAHIELGRINNQNFIDIWQNHPELNRLRNRDDILMKNFPYCNGCEYVRYCTGGCPALAYSHFGNENHPSPEGCLRRYLNSGGKIPV